MIIGGGAGDIRKSVEMFNWKTLAQCRMPGKTIKKATPLFTEVTKCPSLLGNITHLIPDLTVYVQGHVGGVLEGRPLFCVQV